MNPGTSAPREGGLPAGGPAPSRGWSAARVAEGAVIAAAYAALTVYLAPMAFGPYQLRVSEMLKPLVIWEPHLIPAFVVGNFLGNLTSPFVGPWELLWMPFANLVGGWAAWRLGRAYGAYLGATAYAVIIAAAVTVMLSVVLHASLRALFPPLLTSEVLLIVLGVPVMQPVHAALRRVFKDPARRV